MGRTYVYECEKCGYQPKIAGGPSEGLEYATQTILCQECMNLRDVVTSLRIPVIVARGGQPEPGLDTPPPVETLIAKLPSFSAAPTRWKAFDPVCPISRDHTVRQWKYPDKCPRCGVFMERGAIPYRIWN